MSPVMTRVVTDRSFYARGREGVCLPPELFRKFRHRAENPGNRPQPHDRLVRWNVTPPGI